MGNPVVHFEVTGPDGIALQKFYGDLFGWKIENMPEMNYGLVDTNGGEGINGGIGASEDGSPLTTVYIAVPDLQVTLEKIELLGGKIVLPITEIPNIVTLALFADRQSNVVGLVKADGHEHAPGEEHDHGPSKGQGAPVGWFEIASADPKDARAFYTEVFGWKIRSETEGDFIYYEIDAGTTRDAEGIEGAISSTQDGASRVTIWAKVADPAAALAKAEKLGGKKLYDPMPVNDNLTVAAFTDPASNFFGVYNYKG